MYKRQEALYSPDFQAPAAELRRAIELARMLPERVQEMLRYLRNQLGSKLTYYDYDLVWQQILKIEREAGLPTFPGAFVDWDNTARYVKRARIFKGASPERFAHWFEKLVEVTGTRPPTERVIFLNAWNEWAEGTYLEPDERHGYKYIEAVRDALARAAQSDRMAAD